MLIPSLRITNPLTQRSLPHFLGYCSFFPFPPLEIIKSLVGTKEKSFFEHSSPKKASGVSSRKKITIFPRDSNNVINQLRPHIQIHNYTIITSQQTYHRLNNSYHIINL